MTLYDIWQRDHAADFAAGVRLLAQHDGAKYLTRTTWLRLQTLAATGDYIGTYNHGKLEGALQKVDIAQDADAPTTLPTKPPAVPLVPAPAAPGKLTSDKAIALHKEHAHVHALMVSATTDEDRAAAAILIMEGIRPELDKEYDRLRGNAPDSAPVVEDNKVKKLLSVRSSISALKGKINKAKDPAKKAKLEKQLADKIAEKERLEAELA